MANNYAFFYKSENGDRVYDDSSFEHWLKKFFTSGVFLNDLQVTANDDMTVTVGTGYVNADGKVKVYENATTLALATAGGTYPRIDSIVLERNDSERDILLKVITGGYSTNPVTHTPVRQNGVYQLVIAQIYVGTGVVKVTQKDITDTRADAELCGIVASTVDQIDFGQVQAQFNDWFEHVKGQLDEDAAGNLQNQVDDIKANLLYKPNLLLNGDFKVNRNGKTTYTSGASVDNWTCGETATLTVVDGGVVLSGTSATLTQELTGQVESGERYTVSVSIDGVVYTYNTKVYQNLEMASELTDNVKVTINGYHVFLELINECLDSTINWIRVDKGDVAYPHMAEDYEAALSRCGAFSEAITELNSKIPNIRKGIAYLSTIATGKTQVEVTFDEPMPDTSYIVLSMQNLNYIDIQIGIPSGGKRTDGFTLELWSTRTSAVSGANVGFAWLAISLE